MNKKLTFGVLPVGYFTAGRSRQIRCMICYCDLTPTRTKTPKIKIDELAFKIALVRLAKPTSPDEGRTVCYHTSGRELFSYVFPRGRPNSRNLTG
jgi:hypothetical protein